MAEKKLRLLLKAPIVSWSANAISAVALLSAWRVTGSVVWLAITVLFAVMTAFWNESALRVYKWMYNSLWVIALLALAQAAEPALVIALAAFFGALLFVILGVAHVRFHEPFKQLSLFYFLLVCAAAALFALQGPVEHVVGTILVMLVFPYLTGREYLRAEISMWNSRIRTYLAAIVLITAEVLWILSLLSIGFLNVATLILVLYMVSMTIVVNHFQGVLTPKILVKDMFFFGIFSVVIFIISGYV